MSTDTRNHTVTLTGPVFNFTAHFKADRDRQECSVALAEYMRPVYTVTDSYDFCVVPAGPGHKAKWKTFTSSRRCMGHSDAPGSSQPRSPITLITKYPA